MDELGESVKKCLKNKERIRLFLWLNLLVLAALVLECQLLYPERITLYEGEALPLDGRSAYFLDVPAGNSGVLDDSGEIRHDSYGRSLQLNESGDFSMTVKLFGLVPVRQVTVDVLPQKEVVACGNCVGIKIFSEGLICVGTQAVTETNGISRDVSSECDIRVGDIFVKVGDDTLENTEEMLESVEKSSGDSIFVTILRDGREIEKEITPVKTKDGYRLGFWLRDSTAGIGTLTFYDPETMQYGALGHPITDSDTGLLMPASEGEVLDATVLGVVKGEQGKPGALRGVFKMSESSLGSVDVNTERGIYGTLKKDLEVVNQYPIASKNQIKVGSATMLSNISGDEVESFDVEVQQNLFLFGGENKNMVIRVTDDELLERTGGIVQGMGGSPIIQDGKLVGAVTHVFVNDPTRGYGIFIENMLSEAGKSK